MHQQTFISNPNRKNVRLVQIFGILHIITSVLIFSFGVVVLAKFNLNRELNAHATPVWGIASFLVTGILGVVVFCQPQNRALVISHNAFAIISSCLSAGILIASSFGIKYYDCKLIGQYPSTHYYYYYRYTYYSYINYYDPFECWSKTIRDIGQPIYGMLVALSTLELIFSIVSAVYGFRVFNCCASSGNCCTGCYDESANGCNCDCENKDRTSQTYQMQPVNTMGFQVHQQQQGYIQAQFQHPNPSYLQQIPNQQIGFSPTQQAEVVTSSSGQQFVLVPLSQMQAPAPNQPVVTATVPSVNVVQGRDSGKPPMYHEQTAQLGVL